jgi:hypothetical protein
MNRIPCVLSRSANAAPEAWRISYMWQLTMNQALGMLRYSSRVHLFVSLCCILKPLHVEHNWVLNNGSIVQGVLRFWSISQFSVGNGVMFIDCCNQHLSTKMSNMCFDPRRFRIKERFPWHILFLPNACGCRQLQLPCATSQKEDHENLIKISSDN